MERIIVTRRESIVDFFVYAMKNTVLCIRYFSNTKHKSAKKKLDNVFQSNCSSHAELPTNLRKIEKRPKIRHKAVMHPALQLLAEGEGESEGEVNIPETKLYIFIVFTLYFFLRKIKSPSGCFKNLCSHCNHL